MARAERDRVRRAERIAAGQCGTCGKEPLAAGSKSQGPACLTRVREAAQRRLGLNPWEQGKRGRPPLAAALAVGEVVG